MSTVVDSRTVRCVVSYDMGLNPTSFSIFLRDDAELIDEHFEHFEAFVDWYEAHDLVRHRLAERLVHVGWWC